MAVLTRVKLCPVNGVTKAPPLCWGLKPSERSSHIPVDIRSSIHNLSRATYGKEYRVIFRVRLAPSTCDGSIERWIHRVGRFDIEADVANGELAGRPCLTRTLRRCLSVLILATRSDQ